MSNGKLVAALLVSFVAGLAVGRYTLPAKVITKVETKEVIKYVEKTSEKKNKEKKNNKEIVVVETVYPNGKRVKRTHIVDKGTVVVDLTKESEKNIEKEKETKKEEVKIFSKNDWVINGLISTNLFEPERIFSYGLMINRRVLGPFYVGGFVLTDKTAGGSLGVTF